MVTATGEKQHSNVGLPSEFPDPEVSLLHFLCNRHRRLNELLDKLEPLLVERGELIRKMGIGQPDEAIWRVERELASRLTAVLRIADDARRQIAAICRGNSDDGGDSDDIPF
jgi:hypothetical protein